MFLANWIGLTCLLAINTATPILDWDTILYPTITYSRDNDVLYKREPV